MSEVSESGKSAGLNPLIWVVLVVAGLIAFVFLGSDREGPGTVQAPESKSESGTIDRSLLVPPGMAAREYIRQVRQDGEPYPLDAVFDKADQHMQDGSLADAHLLYFFAAREDHLQSLMVMGEMSDPTLFRAEDSLLDHADVIQSYKWYQKAAEMGHQAAIDRVDSLKQWAEVEAVTGNAHARQLLLNFE